jgi:DNA repair exonuclease SbcCD nuclease subunit
MVKIAMITDTHYGVRNDSPVFHENFKKSFDFFFRYLDDHNIKHVVHLGDLFDRRKYLSYLTSSLCRSTFLDPLTARNVETHIIAGNHDHYYTNTYMVNSLDEIVGDRYPTIKVYNTPRTVNVGGLDILLLPWINQANKDDTHEAIQTSPAQIVMGHLELSGFEMFRGVMSEHGDDVSLYSKYRNVYSGHYHHRSTVKNVSYVGAFSEHTWADYNDPKGFSILDSDTLECEFVANPNSIFHMIPYDDKDDESVLKTINSTDYSVYHGSYVKVICANRTNAFAFDQMMDKLYAASPADITVIESAVEIENKDDVVLDQSQDTTTIIQSYVDNIEVPVDSKRLVKFLHDVYTEALALENVE